jgi:hypothetical protein
MAFTAVADGDWTNPATWGGVAPSSDVSNQDIIIPSGMDVILNTDVTFSGLLNSFTVDGTLTSTSTNSLTIEMGTFSGSGDIDIQRIIFDGVLTAYSFSGDLTVNTFVNMGAALAMTSQATVSDSLNLDGGTLTLSTGGNLTVGASSTIIRNSGSLATTGGVFNSSGDYHVHYIGGAKTTGIEINSLTLQNVNISLDDVTTILTMGSDMMVHGDLELDNGILSVGANDLEIHGNIDLQTGTSLTTTAASNLTIETANALNSGLVFTAGSSIDHFTIEHTGTGSVELGSPLSITGELQLHDGTLSIEGGSTLTMNAGSLIQVMDGELESSGGTFIGTASYDVEYIGDSTVTTGLEITGTGLNDVEVNLGEGEVILAGNATVGGELELTNGKLNLNTNDLVLNGTLNQDAASPIIGNMDSDLHLNITVTDEDTLYMDDYDQNLGQLVVDVTGGDIVLGSLLYINDELTMTNGNVVLMNDNLVIKQNSDITGYSDTRYIITPWDGMLEMYVGVSSPYVVFPVGTMTSYSPASIQQVNSATAGNFMVKAYDGVFVNGTQHGGFNSALTASVVNRTWWIESDATTLDMNLKLGWMTGSEVNGFDRTNAFVSHYDGSWDIQAGNNAVAGMNNTYELDRNGITSLSPFTVADEDAELIVDENDLLSINLYPNPCTDIMNISYTTTGNYSYQVTDVTGRIYDVVNKGSNQMDVSALSTGSYLLRMTNIETNKTTVKQFVKK